jgi:hypothetical protein
MSRFSLAFFVSLALATPPGCYSHLPAGVPHYYGKWTSRQIPIEPAEPLSRVDAMSRPIFYEAFFDNSGRIVRFVEYADGVARSETTYSYRPDRSFEERNCNGSTLIVTIFADGKEVSSNTVRGGCSIGK